VRALILAGGLGTRLRGVVSDRPKPMAEVQDRPFLLYLIEQLKDQGFHDLVLCVGYRAAQVQDYLGDGGRWGVHIDYAVERELLGTAGAMRNAREWIHGAFLVLNGDSYLDLDLRDLAARHGDNRRADATALGTLAAVRMEDAAAYGALELGEGGRILRLREKGIVGPAWVNGGVYVLEPEILDLIPTGRPVSIEKETFPLLLERGWSLYAYPAQGFFVDIGTPEGYMRFQRYVQEVGA